MLFANSMTLALDHCSLGPVEDVNIPSVVFALNLKFNSSQTFFFPFSVEERLNGTLSISRNLASFVCFFFLYLENGARKSGHPLVIGGWKCRLCLLAHLLPTPRHVARPPAEQSLALGVGEL